MNIVSFRVITLIAAIGLVAAIFAGACGGGEPHELDIQVEVLGDTLVPETIKVKHNDMVNLKIEAGKSGEFHIHGYDIKKDVIGGETADLAFEAAVEGRFPITFHEQPEAEHSHEEGSEEVEIGLLEVSPR